MSNTIEEGEITEALETRSRPASPAPGPAPAPSPPVSAPLIRVVSAGPPQSTPVPAPRETGLAPPAAALDGAPKADSPFSSFFSVSAGSDPGFVVTPAPAAGTLADTVADISIREIMRSSSVDSTADMLGEPPGRGAGAPELSRRRSRMAWGQGLKRQVSTPREADLPTAASSDIQATEETKGVAEESRPDAAAPVRSEATAGAAPSPSAKSTAPAAAPESPPSASPAQKEPDTASTPQAEGPPEEEEPAERAPATPLWPAVQEPVVSAAMSPDESPPDVLPGVAASDTPNTGVSLKLPCGPSSAMRYVETLSAAGTEARPPPLPVAVATPPAAAPAPAGESHKKRAMRGVADNTQFNSENGQFKRSKSSGTLSPGTVGAVEERKDHKKAALPRGSDDSAVMEMCLDTAGREEDDLLSPDSREVGGIMEQKRAKKAKKDAEGKHLDHGDDDGGKRKRGRPSTAPQVGGRGPPGGRGSRGGGRQGRGTKRRLDEQGELPEGELSASSAGRYEPQTAPALSGMSELGGAAIPAAPANRLLLLGSNSVKLCKSHRQRLKAKQQRDPMVSILGGKQDNINVFVAIHEIVRLELDSQGIDLMRLDPAQVIDPRIIQLLRNISHPSSIINLSILNCSDVASSLNLLETKGHKLYAELNAILQEMYRLQKERARLYDVHLRTLEQRQKTLTTQEAQRRGIVQSEGGGALPVVAEVPVQVSRSGEPPSPVTPEDAADEAEACARDAYGGCASSNSSSTPLILPANHPAYKSLIKNVMADNKSTIEDATFSTGAKSMQVAYNAIVPPDFVSLLHNMSVNKMRSNVTLPCGNKDHSLAGCSETACDKVLYSQEFLNMNKKIKDNRAVIVREMRRRKLATREAWEYLQDQFEETQHKWSHHVGVQMKEIAEKQAVLDNMTRSQAAALGQEAAKDTPTASGGSVGGLGDYALPVPSRPSGSSTRGLRAPEPAPDPAPPSDGAGGGGRLYGMRSTANSSSTGNLFGLGETGLYDHDAVMQQIAMAELMQKRISIGWAPVPSLLSPWTGPKRGDPPPPNEWPQSIASLYEEKKKPVPIKAIKKETVKEEADPVELEVKQLSDEDDSEAESSVVVSTAVNSMVDAVVARATDGSDSADVADAVLTDVLGIVCVTEEKDRAEPKSSGAALVKPLVEPVVKVEKLSDELKEGAALVHHPLVFPEPYPASPEHFDAHCNRLTTNGMRQTCGFWPTAQPCPAHCNCALRVDIEERRCRVWTDMEKCIFVDKFVQYPKNFPKISSYLVNRSVKDCVKYYYDSKHSFGFKALLRECQARRRAVKSSWRQGIVSAASAGGAVYGPDDNDDKRPLFELPYDDMTYMTRSAHPPHTDSLLHSQIPLLVSVDNGKEVGESDGRGVVAQAPAPGGSVLDNSRLPKGTAVSKMAAGLAGSLDGRYMRPKTASTYMRRLLDTCDSGSDVEEEPVENIRNNGYLASVIKKRKFEINGSMGNGLSNAARIVADVEKAISNNDYNVGEVPRRGSPAFGDSAASHLISRPWRIASACGPDASSAPVKPTVVTQYDTTELVTPAALAGSVLGAAVNLKTDPGVTSPVRGRPRGPMSPRGGRGRGHRDPSGSPPPGGDDGSGRGRGRGRGRGSRGGRGRGKAATGDRPDSEGPETAKPLENTPERMEDCPVDVAKVDAPMEELHGKEEKMTEGIDTSGEIGLTVQHCEDGDSDHDVEEGQAADEGQTEDVNQDECGEVMGSPGCETKEPDHEKSTPEASEPHTNGAEIVSSIVGEVVAAMCPESPPTSNNGNSGVADDESSVPAVVSTPKSCDHSPDVSDNVARKRSRKEDVPVKEAAGGNGAHAPGEAPPLAPGADVVHESVEASDGVPSPKRAKLGSPTEMDVISSPVVETCSSA